MLTVRAGLKLKLAAAAAITRSGTSSNLQQVSGIRFQSIQSHICALASQDGIAGLLFLLQETRETNEKENKRETCYHNIDSEIDSSSEQTEVVWPLSEQTVMSEGFFCSWQSLVIVLLGHFRGPKKVYS